MPESKVKSANLNAIRAELLRIEEDCIHTAKAHFNASQRWRRYNYFIGVPSVILSSIASIAFFGDYPAIGGAISCSVAILTALLTFLKPSERSISHEGAGNQYLSVRNDTRVFRTVKIDHIEDAETIVASLDEFSKRRNELNQVSPVNSKSDFIVARQGIEDGEATHQVDKDTNVSK